MEKASLSTEQQSVSKPSPLDLILKSRTLIFVMLFGVTGFLGLPVLWLSPSFSNFEKCFWSVVNILYTLLLIAITIAICWWSWSRISANAYFPMLPIP